MLASVLTGVAQVESVRPEGSPAEAKAQDSIERYALQPGGDPENRLLSPFIKHLAEDQRQFWTAPTRLHLKDTRWIVPFAGVTSAFVASDSWLSKQVPVNSATNKRIFDYGLYSFIGVGGTSFLLGHLSHNDHLEEAGLLSGEAAINSTAIAYLLKGVTERERPYQGNGKGDFFKGGTSFPSEHSAIAWSIASVWAHEYPGTISQIAAYGLASAVSMTRVTAKQHFASDVLIGAALGWYFGRQVYRAHHDPELGGSGWGPLIDHTSTEHIRNPDNMASPYLAIDSWVYPAIQRLAALGYIDSAYLGIRPWTRMACARMLEEAAEKLRDDGIEGGETEKTYRKLAEEFSPELERLEGAPNLGVRVDSVYTRSVAISGTPLRDGYHFGQSLINDYGRPYWTGFNNVTGLTADAEVGPVSFYFQGEYQHAPAIPSEPQPVLGAIGAADLTPSLPDGRGEANRFQLLNSGVAWQMKNVQLSFGIQTEWLGPGEGGPLLMSNNAAPFPTFKIDTIVPYEIPLLSRLLGPVRSEFFIGQLSGQQWELCLVPGCPPSNPAQAGIIGPYPNPQPFIHGEKISFKPTRNLEIGMGVTAMFGGPGLPVTWRNFFRSYYSHTSGYNDPGKRFSAADFSYRMPGLRKWLTVYADSLVVDEYSPIGSTRAAINPGIYMPQIPKMPKWELRAEGINESRTREFTPGFVYYGVRRYRSGYTNDGYLLGSWIGRASRGGQGWLTYSLSPRTKFQLSYRLQDSAKDFIGGGRLVDYSGRGEFMLSSQVALSALFQYEHWKFPVLSPNQQSDVTTSVGLTFFPKWRAGK